MALYSYQALSQKGKKVSGSLDASSMNHARKELTKQGLYPISLQLATQGSTSSLWASLTIKPVTFKEKIFFTQQLRTLLHAGVPVVDALDLLQQQSEGQLKQIIASLRDTIKEGGSLADGLEKFPKVFQTIYVQLARAGEATGNLEVILDRLSEYLVRREEIQKKVKGALTYPAIQLGAVVMVVTVLMVFVVPGLVEMFEADEGGSLPLPTQVLQSLSDFFVQYYIVIFGMCTLLYLGYRAWKLSSTGARVIDGIKLKIPLVKYFARTSAVVQFSRTLGLLIESGVNLAESLDIVCKIVDNRVLVEELQAARENIIKQGKVAEYLKKTGIFPPIAIYLIRTGEKSGQLGEMLQRVGEQYEKDLEELSDTLTDRLGPIILVIMAVVVGFIVLAVILPMVGMVEMMSGV